jgi:polyhydroxybutyrate depolymerase
MSRQIQTALILFSFLIGCNVVTPQVTRAGGVDKQETLSMAGTERTYTLHVPAGLHVLRAVPLVIALHGRYGTGKDQEKLSGLSSLADEKRFLIAYPDGVGRSWNAGHGVGAAQRRGVDDVHFISELIEAIARGFPVDRRRIYAVGMSMGGILAHRLACELSDKIAAVASVAGPMSADLESSCGARGGVSVMHLHGTADRIVRFEGGDTRSGGRVLSAPETTRTWAERNRCKMTAKTSRPAPDVECETYSGCQDEAEVVLCALEGSGHTWAGGRQYAPRLMIGTTNRSVSASEMIWQFFDAHPKSR